MYKEEPCTDLKHKHDTYSQLTEEYNMHHCIPIDH